MHRSLSRISLSTVLHETAAIASASTIALLLLLYLHHEWRLGWALVCGLLGGVALRRVVRPSYLSFPYYLRQPLSGGVILLGSLVASWATLARDSVSYWLLRWREAATMPILAAVLGLGLAGIIYTHSRLQREVAAKERPEEDLRVANRIQQNLLSSPVPERDWLQAYATNIASREVGGDYYEILDGRDREDGSIAFAVGDVSGKGVPAALLMSTLQSAFLAAYSANDDLAEVCTAVNQFLHDRTTPERYAPFFVGIVGPDLRLTFVNDGHNPPLLIPAASEVTRLFGGGRPLGLFGDSAYRTHTLQLSADDLLVAFTDGVTEAADESDEEFGETRLVEVVQRARRAPEWTPEQITNAVLRAIDDHAGAAEEQADDITMLMLRLAAAENSRGTRAEMSC